MSPKNRHSFTVAAVVVGITAIAAIATIQGWLPEWGAKEEAPRASAKTRITGTAPPETLSPGESVVTPAPEAQAMPPAAAPAPQAEAPAPETERPKKAAPTTPSYAPPRAAPARPSPPPPAPPPPPTADASRLCANCGVVASTTYRDHEVRGGPWEVRVHFDDGSRRILRYPTHPGFQVGDRVFFSRGRLHRD